MCMLRAMHDTEIKAKQNNMMSEIITFRITKAKAKVKFGVKYLCGHKCKRSSVQLISIRKRKRKNIFGELISLSFPCQWAMHDTRRLCLDETSLRETLRTRSELYHSSKRHCRPRKFVFRSVSIVILDGGNSALVIVF